jgi:CheY-like chemotaxis protein
MTRTVIVIDDNSTHLEFVVTLLIRAGFSVEGFTSARRALQFAASANPAVVVTDVFMPDMDGIEVLRFIQRELPHVGVVAISGSQWNVGSHYLLAMSSLGAAEILPKPIDPDALVAAVTRLYRATEPLSACGAA